MTKNYINRLQIALDSNNLDKIKECLKYIDINSKLVKGRSVLTYSTEQSLEVARYLIDNGADVNHQDDIGLTPLIWNTLHGNYEIVELLVEKGADITCVDRFGHNALYYFDLCCNKRCPYYRKIVSLLGGKP